MKSILLLALVCITTIGELVLARHSNLHEWAQYKRQFEKVYETPEEDSRRFSLFMAAKERIKEHNSDEQASYKRGLNHLSDLSTDEFAGRADSRFKRETPHEVTPEARNFFEQLLNDSPPKEVDWRKQGRVTSVKSMDPTCAGGWAYAAAGVLEGQMAVRVPNKPLISLSVQNILDCSHHEVGCSAEVPVVRAYEEMADYGGIESYEDYPIYPYYEKCHFNMSKSIMSAPDDAYLFPHEWDDDKLMRLIANFGPVSTLVYTNGWQDYKSGVFDYRDPDITDTDTSALIVGYGTDPKLGDYWLVKHCWSEKWGEAGYIRIRRQKDRRVSGLGKDVAVPIWYE